MTSNQPAVPQLGHSHAIQLVLDCQTAMTSPLDMRRVLCMDCAAAVHSAITQAIARR